MLNLLQLKLYLGGLLCSSILVLLVLQVLLVLSWPFPATSLKTMINSKCEKLCGKMCFKNAILKKCEKMHFKHVKNVKNVKYMKKCGTCGKHGFL